MPSNAQQLRDELRAAGMPRDTSVVVNPNGTVTSTGTTRAATRSSPRMNPMCVTHGPAGNESSTTCSPKQSTEPLHPTR
jgi:hypothetical protein